jgi:hypothetical protein
MPLAQCREMRVKKMRPLMRTSRALPSAPFSALPLRACGSGSLNARAAPLCTGDRLSPGVPVSYNNVVKLLSFRWSAGCRGRPPFNSHGVAGALAGRSLPAMASSGRLSRQRGSVLGTAKPMAGSRRDELGLHASGFSAVRWRAVGKTKVPAVRQSEPHHAVVLVEIAGELRHDPRTLWAEDALP